MNRFIINLRTLNAADPAEVSQRQHLSRFSVPNFRIPQSFLGNIGENLTHGDGLSYVDSDDEDPSPEVSDEQLSSSRGTDEPMSPGSGTSMTHATDLEVSSVILTPSNVVTNGCVPSPDLLLPAHLPPPFNLIFPREALPRRRTMTSSLAQMAC